MTARPGKARPPAPQARPFTFRVSDRKRPCRRDAMATRVEQGETGARSGTRKAAGRRRPETPCAKTFEPRMALSGSPGVSRGLWGSPGNQALSQPLASSGGVTKAAGTPRCFTIRSGRPRRRCTPSQPASQRSHSIESDRRHTLGRFCRTVRKTPVSMRRGTGVGKQVSAVISWPIGPEREMTDNVHTPK